MEAIWFDIKTFIISYGEFIDGIFQNLDFAFCSGCGGRIIGAYGTIQSPDYPNRYPHDVECVWKVTTEVGTKVRLTVQELDIERGHDRECYFDGLEVRIFYIVL